MEYEGSVDAIQSLEATAEAFTEMESLLKKNFKLSHEKLMKFTDNNPIQITLREELEIVSKERDLLEKTNQEYKLQLMNNRENDNKSMLEMHSQMEKMKQEMQMKQLDLDD